MQNLIEQINTEIAAKQKALGDARRAAECIPSLEADVQRLVAAAKALGAPQTPAGRRRIGDGQRKRRKGDSTAAAAPATTEAAPLPASCGHCNRSPAPKCADSNCDWCVCYQCATRHNQRFHAQ